MTVPKQQLFHAHIQADALTNTQRHTHTHKHAPSMCCAFFPRENRDMKIVLDTARKLLLHRPAFKHKNTCRRQKERDRPGTKSRVHGSPVGMFRFLNPQRQGSCVAGRPRRLYPGATASNIEQVW